MRELMTDDIVLDSGETVRARKSGGDFFTSLADAPAPGSHFTHGAFPYEVIGIRYGTRFARVEARSIQK